VKRTSFNFERLGVQEAVDMVTVKLQELTDKRVSISACSNYIQDLAIEGGQAWKGVAPEEACWS